jgi:hypothetical protein
MSHETQEGSRGEARALVDSLQARGFSLEIVGDKLHIRPPGRLTDEERAAVRRLKDVIISQTLHQTGTTGNTYTPAPPAAWDQVEADALVAGVLARRRELFSEADWPADPAAYRRLQPLAGAVDDAEWAKDMAGLRQAVRAFLAAIEEHPARAG